jgi:murein L,D-transpeptidase YcbB/YkuD
MAFPSTNVMRCARRFRVSLGFYHMAQRLALTLLLFVGALAATPYAAHAAPPAAPLAPQLEHTRDYRTPVVRQVHIVPSISGPSLLMLFGGGGSQAKILREMGNVSIFATDDIARAIEGFYGQPKAKTIWVDAGGPTSKAIQALSFLKQADDWGLNAGDYTVRQAYTQFPRGSTERTQALAQFEASLSAKFLMFLQDNYRGRIDPNALSHYYDFKRKSLDLVATLNELGLAPNLSLVVKRVVPDNEKFAQLAIELQFLRSSSASSKTFADINKVVVAMEELRWLPREFPDRYVFINQPAYMAYYHENGQLALSMKAVIGQQDHQTNFFNATIKTVEFNPDWGVPQSIIQNEMLPKLRRDPNYLDREGYKVSVKGKMMPSAKVDWSQPLDNISVVQPPGPENALGRLKILFPNPHAIYMHDTPARGKFASQDRMFSHGCIRLQNPQAMAAAVLKTSVDFVDGQIADGAKKEMPVPEELPVYVAYFTAWPTADGIVHYYDDIYGRDAETLNAIAAITASRSNT